MRQPHRNIQQGPPLQGGFRGGLYRIAAEVFSGLVTFQQIQEANGIKDANLIFPGQELRIPLPRSCDEVDGEKVVHYGHIVTKRSTVAGIAREFNTTEKTLLALNGLATPDDLEAGSVLDVPLKACRSMVSNTSLDNPLLVPNGTYVFTAGGCVMCNCTDANNFTLQCGPFRMRSPLWPTCPSMQCGGGCNLLIGNGTSSSCNRTTCAYAGYANQNHPSNPCLRFSLSSATKMGLQGWRWNELLIALHLVLFYLHIYR